MKLQILQENLDKAVSIASRFASPKAQLPILGNVLISTQKSKIFISATNLEMSVSVGVGAKVEEDGEISIPAKVIAELISNLPKDTITLSSEKEQLKVSTSVFSSTVLGMDATDFPEIPNSVNKNGSVSILKKDLVEALSQVSFSASLDETRPVLTGVLFIWRRNELTLVATDGFRLSKKKLKVDGIEKESRQILPKSVLSEVARSNDGNEADILFSLQEKDKQIIFGIGETVLTSRLLEGDYPDFEKIIPKNPPIKILVDKEEFLRAVKLASIFARDAANVVKIIVLKENLKIVAESGQSGSQETKVDAKVEGITPDFEISFNFRFLEEFIHSVNGEEVKMEFSTTTAAGIFTDSSDSNYLHLIMPVRV